MKLLRKTPKVSRVDFGGYTAYFLEHSNIITEGVTKEAAAINLFIA